MSFEGEIGEIDLIDKLVELGRENFTGAIRFENDGIIKIIYFKSGDILSASTNDRSDSIDEILLRAGKVTREHVKQALSKRKETETLGDAMLGLGFITRKELTWARRAQAIGILRSLRGWTAGQYTIVEDYLPKREEGTLFPLQQMLVELVVTETDRSRFDKATDGGSAVFHKSDTFDDAFRKLGLNQDAEDIARYIDGRNSAADVAASSGKDAFNVYKLLEALRALGLLTKAQAFSHLSSFDDFEQAGVADAADAWHAEEPPVAAPSITAPSPEPQPSFDLDDEPALTYTAPPSTTSAWDEPDEPEPVAPAPATAPMPAWDSTPKTREIPPPPAAVAPALQVDPEPEWGFDEAQLETSRRAVDADEEVKPGKKGAKVAGKGGKRSGVSGMLIVALAAVLLFVAGWYGWGWWTDHHSAPAPVAVNRPTPRKRPRLTPLTTTTATTTSITPVIETTTTAPPSNALVVSSTTPPSTTTTAAPAPVTPIVATNTAPPPAPAPSSDATRAKYDAMARESAASAAGAYTLQFELVCETSSLTKALKQAADKVWFTSLSYRGRSCYRVYWGRYASAAEASAAAGEIPASLRENSKPVVVRVAKQP